MLNKAIKGALDNDDFDFPDLPPDDDIQSNECTIYTFFNILQSPWQKLLIDIRNADLYDKCHPRYTINIPINTNQDDIIKILKTDIISQQNIIQYVYIYNNIINDLSKQHYSLIQKLLKENFNIFPKIFVFVDKDKIFETKYSFLCDIKQLNDNNNDDDDDDKKISDQEQKRIELLKYARKQQPSNNQKSFLTLYSERVGKYLEYPDQILDDKLFLGDENSATRKEILKDLQITHVVNCTMQDNEFENDNDINIQYFHVLVYDKATSEIIHYFNNAVNFIQNAFSDNNNNKVFVHCAAGVSRSSTIVIAYLMKIHLMSMDAAIQYVSNRRSCIDPNDGFKLQLNHWKKYNYSVNKNVFRQQLFKLQTSTYL